MTISRLSAEDHLQQLHRQLRGLDPSKYLTPNEMSILTSAEASLEHKPAGTRSQLRAVLNAQNEAGEHSANLRELERQIKKIIEARAEGSDYIRVVQKLDEIAELQAQVKHIDTALNALEPVERLVIELKHLTGMSPESIADELCISTRTYGRIRKAAEERFLKLLA